jgi:hypothetical protein
MGTDGGTEMNEREMIQREVKRAATLNALADAILTAARRLACIGRNEAGAYDAAIEQLQGAWTPPPPPSSQPALTASTPNA